MGCKVWENIGYKVREDMGCKVWEDIGSRVCRNTGYKVREDMGSKMSLSLVAAYWCISVTADILS